MHINHDPQQTRHLSTRMKLILAVPVAILIWHILFLVFMGAHDGMQPII
jgi:hypothetical protein